MKLLAIETATEACSAALYLDGEVHPRFVLAPQRHAELILDMMDGLLAAAGIGLRDLNALAFGRGPGSFTGVRIAAGVIQGVAFGADLPVVPVSTLAALAQGAVRQTGHERILAGVDARMGEVYWGVYQADADGIVVLQGKEMVGPVDVLSVPPRGTWFGCGSAWGHYAELLGGRFGDRVAGSDGTRLPQAHDVATLGARGLAQGRAVAAEQAIPVYLRDNVASRR